jgi:hypothetical protein
MPRFDGDSPFYAGWKKSNEGFKRIINELEGYEEIAKLMSKWNVAVRINAFFSAGEPMRCGFRVL